MKKGKSLFFPNLKLVTAAHTNTKKAPVIFLIKAYVINEIHSPFVSRSNDRPTDVHRMIKYKKKALEKQFFEFSKRTSNFGYFIFLKINLSKRTRVWTILTSAR